MNDIAKKTPGDEVDEDTGTPSEETPQPRAPVLPDAVAVKEHFEQVEATEKTIRDITSHAEAANHLAKMAGDLRHTIVDQLYDRKPDGVLQRKANVDMAKAKQASSLIIALGNAIKSNNATYRLNKGLNTDKTESDVRGYVEHTADEVLRSASEKFGIPLGRTAGKSVPVAEKISH